MLKHSLKSSLDQCFDAVVQPEIWPAALNGLANALGANAAAVNAQNAPADRRRMTLPSSSRYRDMLAQFIEEGWVNQDLRAKRGWPIARTGRKIVCEDDVTTPEERESAPIYRELFARHDVEMFASLGMAIDGQQWGLNIVRSGRDGPFAGAEIRRFLRLEPAIRRLLMFAQHVSMAEIQGALAALERIDKPAVIVDERGCVRRVNASAAALLGRGIDVRGGRLVAEFSASHGALEAHIARATKGWIDDPVIIRREHGEALIVEAIPLQSTRTNIFGQAGAMVLITAIAAGAPPSQDMIRRVFGLTHREGSVAQALAGGESSSSIAERMNLRDSTVRQIVKTVLEKTETSRQSELTAKLSRLPKTPRAN